MDEIKHMKIIQDLELRSHFESTLKEPSMNQWMKAGTYGKVMLRRRKKSIKLSNESNLKNQKTTEDFEIYED